MAPVASVTFATIATIALLLTLSVAPARAGFGAIDLQSVGPNDQFEEATESAISADGRYLVFQGALDGVEGVFRKDLRSGQVQLVAGGSIYASSSPAPTDASMPSISADGNEVSFTTAVGLVAAAHAGDNVYVRDMDVASDGAPCTAHDEAEASCAYELASALNTPGLPTQGLTYSSGAGAVASGRVALSGDGNEVAFVVQGSSNLTSEAGGGTPGVATPPLQVAVRYLDRHETLLVSAKREVSTGQMTELPVAGGAVTPTAHAGSVAGGQFPGAALSADGSTVAWLGAHIPAQAPTLSDEAQRIDRDDSGQTPYDEPLWRRIADGPTAPTRRIIGGGDPLAPGCPSDGTLELAACRGPFPGLATESRGEVESNLGWLSIARYYGVPDLSADGWTVALIGDPPYSTSNVFVADMHEGLDRVQALRQLTREVPVPLTFDPGGTVGAYTPTAGDVYDIAISPTGSRIAFTTEREQFPLAPPYFTETPLAQLGVSELYQVDLDSESLVRVTHGPHDGPSLGGTTGASTPSYTADASTLAFASSASNLVSGDANGAGDVFTLTDTEVLDTLGSVDIGPAPFTAMVPERPERRLSVVAVAHSDGSVTLDVVVPGAGHVGVNALATVPASARGPLLRRHLAHGAKAASKRTKGTARSELESRTVASAQMSATVPSLLELPLRVASPYRKLLDTSAGIYAAVRVRFTGPGGPALTQILMISFHKSKAKVGTKVGKRAKTKQARAADFEHQARTR